MPAGVLGSVAKWEGGVVGEEKRRKSFWPKQWMKAASLELDTPRCVVLGWRDESGTKRRAAQKKKKKKKKTRQRDEAGRKRRVLVVLMRLVGRVERAHRERGEVSRTRSKRPGTLAFSFGSRLAAFGKGLV